MQLRAPKNSQKTPARTSRDVVVMASIDVRDAFLQVEQSQPILVHLQNEPFVINRNLPGQRLGAKQWFLHLQAFLKERMDFQFSSQFGAGVLLPGRAPGVIAAHFVIVLVSTVLQVFCANET